MKLALGRVNYSQLYGFYDDGATYEHRDVLIPYQLLALATDAQLFGAEVRIFDGEVDLASEEILAERILEWEADAVGLTATTPDIEATLKVCGLLKASDSDIKTIVGGAHVTAVGHPGGAVDYAVKGRGERALVEILSGRQSPGVVKVDSLGVSDSPHYPMLDYSDYQFTDPTRGQVNAASVMSAQGCPFKCAFCSRGQKLRYKSIDKFIREIKWLYEIGRVRYFYIYDETFLLNTQRTTEILRRLKPFKDARFQCLTRANLITPDMARQLRNAGFVRVSMGLESGSDEILRCVSKGITRADGAEACRALSEAGIETRASFILGLPHETHETARQTIEFAKDLDLYHANFNIMTPYPGTATYKMACRGEGLRFAEEEYKTGWSHYRRWGKAIVTTPNLSAKSLERYQATAQKEFYARDKILDYYTGLFERGNTSRYAYRPLNFAWRQKFGQDIPFWNSLDESKVVMPKGGSS